MKRLYFLFFLLFVSFYAIAQEDSVFYDDEYEYYEPPINIFSRLSFSTFTMNSSPSELNVQFWDDDINTDSISGTASVDGLWSYGLNFGLGFLLNKDLVLNIDNHLGFGAGGRLFNYIGQIGLGKEFRFNKIYIQPIMSLGYISTNFKMGEYPSSTKGYFEVNDRFIFDDLTVRIKGRGFSLSPALFLEYSIRRDVSVFAKASVQYVFWDTHFVTVGGETDEVDDEGNAVTATERINFDDYRLLFSVNSQPIYDNDSPYLHYNLNGVLFQFGVSLGLSWADADDF